MRIVSSGSTARLSHGEEHLSLRVDAAAAARQLFRYVVTYHMNEDTLEEFFKRPEVRT